MVAQKLKEKARVISDFPKPGIQFIDVSAITADGPLFREVITAMQLSVSETNSNLAIVGIESRGFIFGAAVASALSLPFIMARKKGKLPGETYSCSYQLEYGEATLEMNQCDVIPGRHYVLVDDLIATGGTLGAVCHMIADHGGIVDKVLSVYQIAGLENVAQRNCLAEIKSLCVM